MSAFKINGEHDAGGEVDRGTWEQGGGREERERAAGERGEEERGTGR